MATRRRRTTARRRLAGTPPRRRRGPGSRSRGNRANRAPGTRGMSTREYGRATAATARAATYAYPRGVGGDRGVRPSYPIYDLPHARNALSRAAQRQTAGNVGHIRAALRAKGGAYARLAARSSAGR